MSSIYKVQSEVWIHPSSQGRAKVNGGYHLVSVDKLNSEKIHKTQVGKLRRGFGAVKVETTLGGSVWQTSIFPDKRTGTYMMLLKLSIRKAEGIMHGDKIKFQIKILQ